MNDEPSVSASKLYFSIVAFIMLIALLTLISAVALSIITDATLADQSQDNGAASPGTMTGAAIERLWQGFFSALSGLIGLLAGKRL